MRRYEFGGASAVASFLLSALLALQLILASFPLQFRSEGSELLTTVICGPAGLQQVTVDLATGDYVDDPETVVDPRCPFGLLSAAQLVAPPELAPLRLVREREPRAPPAGILSALDRFDRSRAIRAPPGLL